MSKENPPRICVFGSSAKTTPKYILDESFKLGELIAEKSCTCVNGGGMFGVMGAVNKGNRSKNGKIVGVIHESFLVDVQVDYLIEDPIITRGNDLNERKQLLFDESDCFIIMPGGYGTLDELFDGLCAKGLEMKGLEKKPFVLVNVNGYYDGTVQQLKACEDNQLLYAPVSDNLHIVTCAAEALDWCIEKVSEMKKQLHHTNNKENVIKNVRLDKTITMTTENNNTSTDIITTTTTRVHEGVDADANTMRNTNQWWNVIHKNMNNITIHFITGVLIGTVATMGYVRYVATKR